MNNTLEKSREAIYAVVQIGQAMVQEHPAILRGALGVMSVVGPISLMRRDYNEYREARGKCRRLALEQANVSQAGTIAALREERLNLKKKLTSQNELQSKSGDEVQDTNTVTSVAGEATQVGKADKIKQADQIGREIREIDTKIIAAENALREAQKRIPNSSAIAFLGKISLSLLAASTSVVSGRRYVADNNLKDALLCTVASITFSTLGHAVREANDSSIKNKSMLAKCIESCINFVDGLRATGRA
jgi:hypothetical protein